MRWLNRAVNLNNKILMSPMRGPGQARASRRTAQVKEGPGEAKEQMV